ncbi:MAG: CinA domain protein [Jatrophihabitantaceae bacterium]|nr:CinA domain protein [Jatrophihabitantaceae bacterium]
MSNLTNPQLAEAVGRQLTAQGLTVAVAESLTAGSISCALGAAGGASEWFRGGVTAYTPQVKFDVLGVDPGPVVTGACATQMARGVARLMSSDLSVSTSGVGGPGPQEGCPPGTVHIAVHSHRIDEALEYHFEGSPSDVVEQATRAALIALLSACE